MQFWSAKACFVLAGILVRGTSASLPYNPTFAYLSSVYSEQVVYVLQPASLAFPRGQLLALPVSSGFTAFSPSFQVASSSLPFLSISGSTAFTSMPGNNGVLLTHSGDCSKGVSGSNVWLFEPDPSSTDFTGVWIEEALTHPDLATNSGLTGANFLAGGFTFTSTPGQSNATNMYIFGGMCPDANTTSSTWQASASYSNQVIGLTATSNASNDTIYDVSLLSSPADLIEEAGFSMTALQATVSNSSDDTQFQQQNFVVLGGHTASAFTSTSKVALFSMPQSNWTFLDVEPPISGDNDLRSTSSQEFTTRSGHSAVLTSDGTKIVVFGGWVGDISQAASPQLAVLNIGEGYGGVGSWSWSNPSTTQSPHTIKTGLYGHAAIVLPGDIMMITGGYSIASGSSQTESSSTYLYNITSGDWVSSYVLPMSNSNSIDASNQTLKVGLGVGLGLGLFIVIAGVLLGYCYAKKLRKRREQREEDLKAAASQGQGFQYSHFGGGIDGRGGNKSAIGLWHNQATATDVYPWAPTATGNQNPQQSHKINDAQRTGVFLDLPSPTRGLRRNLSQRGNHAPTLRYGEQQQTGIHPIQEREEDENSVSEARTPQMAQTGSNLVFGAAVASILDPFRDPDPVETQSNTQNIKRKPLLKSLNLGNPSTADSRESAVTEGNLSGRHSPDKSERTASTLSEQSTRSFLSSISAISVMSAFSFGSGRQSSRVPATPTHRNPFNSVVLSPTHADNASGDTDNQSYQTANSNISFAHLQGESETLLGNIHDDDPNFEYRTGPRGSPTRVRSHKMALVGGLVGSVRRAIPYSLRSSSMTSATAVPRSLLDRQGAYAYGSTNPTKQTIDYKEQPIRPAPQRSTSDSGTLLAMKRGAKGWADVAYPIGEQDAWNALHDRDATGRDERMPYTITDDDDEHDHDEENEDWDVEAAIQERRVQVMYTVPREKLRVVNAEVASILSEMDSADDLERKPSMARSMRSFNEAATPGKGEDSPGRGKSLVMERVIELEEKQKEIEELRARTPEPGSQKGKGRAP